MNDANKNSSAHSARWYFSDWMSDPGLRASSLAARGLWKDLICIAAANKNKRYGFVLVNRKPPTPSALAKLVGATTKEVETLLAELSENGVFSRTRGGVIYCRRLVRSRKMRANGQLGGNPKLLNSKETPNSLIHPLEVEESSSSFDSKLSKRLSRKKESKRNVEISKSTLPVDWRPSNDLMLYGRERGLSERQITDAAEDMKTWADENSESKGRKKNWDRTFQGFLRRRQPNGDFHYGQGRPRALQDDRLSASRAAARLAEQAERGEFFFGPRPGSVLSSESGTNVVMLPKGRHP